MRYAGVVLACLLVATGCEKHEFHPPSAEERTAEAETAFAALRFDTIAWSSPEERLSEGNQVFAARCRRCHGPLGQGDGEYAKAEGLAVPSIVGRDWRYAGSADSVRHRVFVGHYPEMQTWGVAGLTPREIDAVTHYVLNRLRPEVLGAPR